MYLGNQTGWLMQGDTAGSYLNQGSDDPGLSQIASIRSLWAPAWSVSKTPAECYMLIHANHCWDTADCGNAHRCGVVAVGCGNAELQSGYLLLVLQRPWSCFLNDLHASCFMSTREELSISFMCLLFLLFRVENN